MFSLVKKLNKYPSSMGKEELLDALAGLQDATSVERISAQFVVIHEGETQGYLLI